MSHLKLIIWKNIIIRKRHWFLTLAEIVVPVLSFILLAYGRSKLNGLNKVHVDIPTYYTNISTRNIFSHLDVGSMKLWYYPETNFTKTIIENVKTKFQIPGQNVQSFHSKKDILNIFSENKETLLAVVGFSELYIPNHLNYDLTLYDKYIQWNTEKLYAPSFRISSETTSNYLYKGYAALQLAIDMSFLDILDHNRQNVQFTIQQFPDPPHFMDSGLNKLFIDFLPLITVFSFMFLCPAVLQRVGEEKASGIKEYMKMVGLKSRLIWLGWFIHALSTNIISIIIIVILMKVPFWGVSYPPIEFCSGTVFFTFLFLYCMAALTLCFLIAGIINRPAVATIVGTLVWIFSYFIPQTFVSSQENLQWSRKILFAIFPNMALYFGYASISSYEMREVSLNWYNIFQSGSGEVNDVTMGTVFIMLTFDTILFMLLTIYLENIKPGDYGIAKCYSFPLNQLIQFLSKTFCLQRVEHSPEIETLDVENGKAPCIQISNLYKMFYKHTAVDGLNMDIYKNRITVLLGQNGAGKTTTMSILTGMINASKGTIIINGKDMKKHTDEVRSIMGLCPQHNLLFPDLTVLEHLKFFAKLRGVQDPDKDSLELLEKLSIATKSNDMVNSLSGGMKRKLCLGMALIGSAEVLILDEPTSGMDPESRRKIWDLLLLYRKSRTILISTHFMEEADVLGDWIGIMANGRLQCYGTPSQLKSKFNTGYHLVLSLKSNHWINNITELIQQHFPVASLLRESDDTVVYRLPLIIQQKSQYYNLLLDLESKQNDYQIASINMNETTLNDVFLKARDEIDGEHEEINHVCDKVTEFQLVHGTKRRINIIYALLRKRYYFLRKKFYWYIPGTMVFLSIYLLALSLTESSNIYSEKVEPPLKLTLKQYEKSTVFYGGDFDLSPKIETVYNNLVATNDGSAIFRKNVSDAIVKAGVENIAFYKKHLIVATELGILKTSTNVNAMFSSDALHSIPISINLATNLIAKLTNEQANISISNTPLQGIHSDSTQEELSSVSVSSTWLILFPLSLCFLMSNFIIFPHTEVSTDFIQIQTIAGIPTYIYWITNILFDVAFATVPLVLVYALTIIISSINTNFMNLQDTMAILLIFSLYLVTSLPFTYLLSYRRTITSGLTYMIMLAIFSGIIPALIISAMEFSNDPYYTSISDVMKPIALVISPPFALSYICLKLSRKFVQNFNWRYMDEHKRILVCHYEATLNPCCKLGTNIETCNHFQNYFSNNELGIGEDMLIMPLAFIVYFGLLLFFNTESYKKLTHFVKYLPDNVFYNTKSNKNVTKKLLGSTRNHLIDESKTLLVEDLTKTFGRKVIVRGLKFHLKKNKCFGLLGVNGAGKSTTFRMLTKYIFFDKGKILLKSDKDSIPITNSTYCENIGYCPQDDCLNYYLSARELLLTMAYIKGYTGSEASNIVETLISYFGLEKYADKPSLEYSGGNKRKLSSCLAFLGCPKVILLDEPTSGVDPASRRTFWKILSSFKEINDTSFLLCSHSMEECENLCDEIAIMKDGEIRDQGTLSSLKNKYQKGVKITVKVKNQNSITNDIKSEISKLNAELVEEFAGTLTYRLRNTQKPLSSVFMALENLKDKYNSENNEVIEDYVINQISLEDIFLSVAEQK